MSIWMPDVRPSQPTNPARDELLDLQFTKQDLTSRLERLTLISQAMWELLSEKCGVTEEMLETKIKEIDLRDGVADGKRTAQIKKCSKCGKVMNPRHNKCLYCGAGALVTSPFDGV